MIDYPKTQKILDYLAVQFPATKGHIPLRYMLQELERPEAKCRHCGSDEGPWFSRIIPMGNFCQACGGPWTELDGVE